MVAQPVTDSEDPRLRPGARGRYAPPPQLFPLALAGSFEPPDNPLHIERDQDGLYLIRQRESGRPLARTADPATLPKLFATLLG